jgi:glycolate oxidase
MPAPSARAISAATSALRRRLGGEVVLTEDAARLAASYDSSRISVLPAAVIRVTQAEQIAPVLRAANRHGIPVLPRGRGTSLTGSAVPLHGGWVLDLLGLDQLRIDAEAGLAYAQAGVKVAALQDAAAAAGWFYPPDPSSKQYSTVGGNIACNAGGMHGGKYGVTRDFVVALKGYLPTGEYVEWGTATRKFAAGFNLRDLWIGSEGMLGIVTEAVLRLVPAPAARVTLLASFGDEVSAFKAARALFASRLQPAICEFLDRYSVSCAEQALRTTIFPGQPGRPVLLLELAGSAAEVREDKKRLLTWAAEHALGHRVARTRAEAEALWTVRRKCSGAMFQMGDAKLNEDITVPLAAYAEFALWLDELRAQSGLAIPTFGHLADGNLHVNIMYHQAEAKERRAAEKAVLALMKKVVALGGAISGEHGIGLAKSPFLRLQHRPAQVRAMQAVKQALDPRGILNPGKLFEVFEVWKAPRVKVAFPWDHK